MFTSFVKIKGKKVRKRGFNVRKLKIKKEKENEKTKVKKA